MLLAARTTKADNFQLGRIDRNKDNSTRLFVLIFARRHITTYVFLHLELIFNMRIRATTNRIHHEIEHLGPIGRFDFQNPRIRLGIFYFPRPDQLNAFLVCSNNLTIVIRSRFSKSSCMDTY